jgi:hypothetical protein
MASVGRQIPPIKKTPSRENRISIMIMRSVGKVRSFKISSHIAMAAVVFFILYIIASIFIANRYFDLRRTKIVQSEMIKQLEDDALKKRKSLQRTTQKVAILEEYIRNLEAPKEREAESVKDANQKASQAYRAAGPVADDRDREEASASIVDIKNMVIQKEGPAITINFRVVNLQPTENPIGGYIHLIAKGKDGSGTPELTFPYEELRNGIPVNFRRGQLFLIQRFKPIQGRFDLAPNSEPPSVIKVLVYDQAGGLILEREFEFDNDS